MGLTWGSNRPAVKTSASSTTGYSQRHRSPLSEQGTIAPIEGKLILITEKAVAATMIWKTLLAGLFFLMYHNIMRLSKTRDSGLDDHFTYTEK